MVDVSHSGVDLIKHKMYWIHYRFESCPDYKVIERIFNQLKRYNMKSIKEIIVTILVMLAIIVFASIVTGCGSGNVEIKSTKYQIKQHTSLELVTVDGCEYLYGDWGNATVLTHKGNCINHTYSIK